MITEWTYFDFKKKIVYLQNMQDERDLFNTVSANLQQHIIFYNDFVEKGKKTAKMVNFRNYTLQKCKPAERIWYNFDCRSKHSIFYGTNRMSENQFVFYLKNMKGLIDDRNLQSMHDFHFLQYQYNLGEISKINDKKNKSADNLTTFFIKLLENTAQELKKNGIHI